MTEKCQQRIMEAGSEDIKQCGKDAKHSITYPGIGEDGHSIEHKISYYCDECYEEIMESDDDDTPEMRDALGIDR